ncbi:MAG: carboxylating nicotinate-nucleotide diphosphorylase [Coriobacteriia bacterium]|nr:carboxylating nicotinate-nucleotide diphosphorylase [Coriobacteriia bacterium]
MYGLPASDELLASALAEDLGVTPGCFLGQCAVDPDLLEADATSATTVPTDAVFRGRVVARDVGVVCGLSLVERTYQLLAAATGVDAVTCFPLVAEGADVVPGTAVLEIEGPVRDVLAGERTALNLLMLLSGIASEARRWRRAAGDRVTVVDTRKTLPGLRALSKYAVRTGGAANHRAGLWDMVLIKDNHIAYAGGVARAIEAARRGRPDLPIECEADTIGQAVEAAQAGADYVLLDNMDDTMLSEAVRAVRESAGGRRVQTEASGRITFERLGSLAATGVDRVSASALTLADPLDFGLDATE